MFKLAFSLLTSAAATRVSSSTSPVISNEVPCIWARLASMNIGRRPWIFLHMNFPLCARVIPVVAIPAAECDSKVHLTNMGNGRTRLLGPEVTIVVVVADFKTNRIQHQRRTRIGNGPWFLALHNFLACQPSSC